MNQHTGVHDKGDVVSWHGISAVVRYVWRGGFPGDRTAGDHLDIELLEADGLHDKGDRISVERWHLDRPS